MKLDTKEGYRYFVGAYCECLRQIDIFTDQLSLLFPKSIAQLLIEYEEATFAETAAAIENDPLEYAIFWRNVRGAVFVLSQQDHEQHITVLEQLICAEAADQPTQAPFTVDEVAAAIELYERMHFQIDEAA